MPFDYEEYEKSIHRMGRFFNAVALSMLFIAPFIFGLFLDAEVHWPSFFKGLVRVAPTYWISCIVEFLIYVPILGAGGSYLAFITGNIINMKLPCAFNAKELARTQGGTKENDIISTLAIATSSLVTMLIIFIGVLLLIPLTPVLQNPALQPAFENILPALFGALAAQYFAKSFKITGVPLILMIILYIAVPSLIKETSTIMIPSGGIAIGITYVLYKKKMLKEED